MTRAQVEINFEEAKRQVRVIEDAVEVLKRADRLHGEMQESLAGGWKGSNANHFQDYSRALQNKMKTNTSRIAELGEWTKHRAQVLYETEMEAIRIAEERAYREQQARAEEAARQAEQARQEEQARAAAEQAARRAADAIRRILR